MLHQHHQQIQCSTNITSKFNALLTETYEQKHLLTSIMGTFEIKVYISAYILQKNFH